MLNPCLDDFHASFSNISDMMTYHQEQSKNSLWQRMEVNKMRVAPLDKSSPLYDDRSEFGAGVSSEAINDTVKNLGLALRYDGQYFPIRNTAYKSLLDRAKIGGSALPKLSREDLAHILNSCFVLHKSSALLLIRDEKVSATHSGDECDYSVLAVDKLLESIVTKLNERFPGNKFDSGYCDHAMVSASWSLPAQSEELIDTYRKTLAAQGKATLASKLMPGIRFTTSDTGMATAKVSALLLGMQYPVRIGDVVGVEHRHQKKIEDFDECLDQIFAQFGNSIKRLEKLTTIYLDYPINAMTAVCKKLSMPKKAALEAINMYEMGCGAGPATAHDVFMGMQEIIFILKSEGIAEGKLLRVEENLARALTIRWPDYDLARKVAY